MESGSYDGETAILVRLNPCFNWGMMYRAELERRTRENTHVQEGKVFGVYYLCEKDFLIDGVSRVQPGATEDSGG